MATCVIGIAGPSCSGKTMLARTLAGRLPGGGVVFELDWYYRDQSGRDIDDIEVDVPDAIDHDLAVAQLQRLAGGETIERPVYDYATHSRAQNRVALSPAPHIVADGLFALYWPPLRALYDLSVFIDADAETCLRRRIARDTRERGRSADSVTRQFHARVWPMFEHHVLPTRTHAGLVLDGSREVNDLATVVQGRLS